MTNNDLISRSELLAEIDRERKRHIDSGNYGAEHLMVHSLRRLVEEATAVDVAPIDGNTSDGYHTFNELYHHRAVLFSVIVKAFPDKAWKARKHHDGSMFDGMFIVGIETSDGQATYHYDLDPYWDMFDCREVELAPEWDGHTAEQAIERIGKLEPVVHGHYGFTGPHIGSLYASHGTCGNCKERILIDPQHKNFCPNCGAKMDEEE